MAPSGATGQGAGQQSMGAGQQKRMAPGREALVLPRLQSLVLPCTQQHQRQGGGVIVFAVATVEGVAQEIEGVAQEAIPRTAAARLALPGGLDLGRPGAREAQDRRPQVRMVVTEPLFETRRLVPLPFESSGL